MHQLRAWPPADALPNLADCVLLVTTDSGHCSLYSTSSPVRAFPQCVPDDEVQLCAAIPP